MKKGILYNHQGWTDIINCLSLINYYLETYTIIYIILREDSNNLVNFYINNLTNSVMPIYLNKKYLDDDDITIYLKNNEKYNDCDLLFHGIHDKYRNDIYNNCFNRKIFFVKSFYTSYNIDYMVRVNNFNINRNYDLENLIYSNFINKYSSNYVLHHEINDNNSNFKDLLYINLNGISEVFFDYIKVIENAKELHLLDSAWGAIIYLLDCKYKLFQNIKIYMYCKRGYNKMFTEPVKLENWIII